MLVSLGLDIMAPEPIYLAIKMWSFLVGLAGHAFSSVQSLSRVRLFATPWTIAQN